MDNISFLPFSLIIYKFSKKKLYFVFKNYFLIVLSSLLSLTFFNLIHILHSPQQPLQGNINLLGDLTSSDTSLSCFELDNEKLTDVENADICFTVSVGSSVFYTISPINDVTAKSVGSTIPSMDDCKNNIDSFLKGSIPELEIGNNICVLTNEDNLARLTIKSSTRVSATGIEITLDYVVWKQ